MCKTILQCRKKYIILFLLFIGLGITRAEAQNNSILLYTPNDYLRFKLPPLDTLFNNAQKNPRVIQTETEIKSEVYKLRNEKRKWLSFFNVRTGYTYGILGNYSSFSDENTPLITTYNGNAQSSWSVGATLSIPLNTLFNLRSDIKTQKERVYSAELNKDITLDELKAQIIDLYTNISSGLKILSSKIEVLNYAQAQYDIAEKEFNNGKSTSDFWVKSKATQSEAFEAYEAYRAQLNALILKLEILSRTKLTK